MTNYITDEIQNNAINALGRMIAQPSYNTDAAPNAPFGTGIRLALDEILKIAKELGYQTYVDPEGYYGYAEIGSGDEIFGLVCHVDVVPAGDLAAWNTNPFELVQKDGALFGRGTQDDKGPTIATMFTLKALLDQGMTFNKKVRFIFGTDEEILWRGMAKYNEKEAGIDMGIAPDAEFPLVYAEKGLQQSYLVGPGSSEIELDLVNAFNAVPGSATYNGSKQDQVETALQVHNFKYQKSADGLIVQGNSVHAMNAPEGTNALLRLGIALADVFPGVAALEFIKSFGEDATGANLMGVIKDDASGQLTFNISSLQINAQESRMQIDMRIPVTVEHDALIQLVEEKVTPFNFKYENFDYLEPLYVPKDGTLVQTLMKAYIKVTGDTAAEPGISGGATFARTMKNSVAFGAMLTTTPDFMHQANEHWPVKDMRMAMEIYAEAFKALLVD
ncbi:Sapep family Mn(2+)-dependent dipeptidase [Weissella coleopterorum]|uniref:Sapep family Mn(2+)-dependent dipeptidase n=1 Tax=Weissella coleopterorum TaxID=2714949 RepID=A0A6G8B0H8_9LACO|nr:M20 family metallopeptidase [Weissella coleopterorum]QIL50730.1 Sapep family Mn(2+)-dependent dipeptidase [Weissella coleopterorum]